MTHCLSELSDVDPDVLLYPHQHLPSCSISRSSIQILLVVMMYLGSQELYRDWRERTKVCHSDRRCRRYNHILFLNLVDLLAEATETSCLCSDLWWCFPSGCEWFSGLHVSGQSCLRMDTDQRSCSGTDQQEVVWLGEKHFSLLTGGEERWDEQLYTRDSHTHMLSVSDTQQRGHKVSPSFNIFISLRQCISYPS